MAQLRQYEKDLEESDVAVVVVTFDDSPMAKSYVQQTNLQWPLLLDVQRDLYKAYGMERADRWSIYGPASIWHYLKLIFQGNRVHKPGKDWRQVGGDVIVDPNGIVQYCYVSSSPHDRPEVSEVLAVIEQANKT